MHDSTYIQTQRQLNHYLAQTGRRQSMERNAVLHLFCREQKSWTIPQLVSAAKEEHISRATVYNALRVLQDADIIHPVAGWHNTHDVAYELVRQRRNELRIVCTKCHRTAEIKDAAITNLISQKKITNFLFAHYQLTIYGECKVCRKGKKIRP